MHFNLDLLNKKIQAIADLQNEKDFVPAKLVSIRAEKAEKARLRQEKNEFRERLKAELKASKETKMASAAMLTAQRMARETQEREEKKAAAAKTKAVKLSKKSAPKAKSAESYWGSSNINTKPVKIKKFDSNLNGHTIAIDNTVLAGPPRPRQEKVYKTRALDLTVKIPVKLDERTTVYADPGYDLEALKEKYLKKTIIRLVGQPATTEGRVPPEYQF